MAMDVGSLKRPNVREARENIRHTEMIQVISHYSLGNLILTRKWSLSLSNTRKYASVVEQATSNIGLGTTD